MNRIVDLRTHSAKHALLIIAGAALFLLTCAFSVRVARAAPGVDVNEQAREQFATAVRMRTMLEGLLEKDRSASDYKQTIAAYEKVWQISADADEAPPSLIAEAELYEEMGHLYDQKYYDTAINKYLSLLNQYPGNRYRGSALFGIAQIQKNDLHKAKDAQATFQEYLKKYPRSEYAEDARKALRQIAAIIAGKPDRSATAQNPVEAASAMPSSVAQSAVNQQKLAAPTTVAIADDPAVVGTVVQPREADGHSSRVKDLHAENGKDAARVIIALDDTIDFQSARIASPDRIYFNLSRATLASSAASKGFDASDGLIRSVHIGQNKPDVVRVVLDAPSAKDYSAYLLSKPYRLVIELRAHVGTAPSREVGTTVLPNAAPAATNVGTATFADGNSVQPKEKQVSLERKGDIPSPALGPTSAPKTMSDGDTSLTRALGLKIHRIVIDPGHGGHDTGTIGPHGLLEKDLCLDVALRLGKMIQQKLPGAEVVYTRQDDTFIPLEERTRIANDAKADLFISIHANSSHDETARGVETYYLNFSTSDESMEVAARENALSQESIHDLQDVIKKIARNDKIEESKELAGDVQESLAHRLETVSPSVRDRGVKQAPFIVLIGADMPSILAEISFVSNPTDEKLLKNVTQRQRIADGLYRGIASYLDSLNSLSGNKQRVSDNAASDSHLEARNTSAAAATAK
jgi:N-acetylmuramoyl-L-alanine amidase